MSKFFEKLSKVWYFYFKNPVVRKGEKGGFRWVFRRFWLEIETLSGNFRARFTASEHPYGYLIAGKDDSNIQGFCQLVYQIGMLLTTDQQFVDDIQKALSDYDGRMQNVIEVAEDENEEETAIEEVKAVQEHIELPEKERRKEERRINREFKKAVKKTRHESE